MACAGSEYTFVVVESNAGGYRNNDFSGQQILNRGKHRFDLVGLHGDDHHVGKPGDRRSIVESTETLRFRITLQFRTVARACADIPGLHSPRADKSAGPWPAPYFRIR